MDYIRIKPVTEIDFDGVVSSCGGRKILEQDSADYLYGNSVVELKLIEEEGFDKADRQQRIAAIFRTQQSKTPVVVVDPKRLDEASRKKYQRSLEGPIKTAVRKAADQLVKTAARHEPTPVRVLVILNVGYTAVSEKEFEEICVKCARNDTRKIDMIICGGIYFHSDKFDSYVFSRFEPIPINLNRFPEGIDALGAAWGKLVGQMVSDVIKSPVPFSDGRMPVLDLSFTIDGVKYVKPAPPMPKSTFWPGGKKPRENSSGITSCPPIAKTFPAMTLTDWTKFKKTLPHMTELRTSYPEWLEFQASEERRLGKSLQPFVPVSISYDECISGSCLPPTRWVFSNLCRFANDAFEINVRETMERAADMADSNVRIPTYVHVVVQEIGQDKANDIASIYLVSELGGRERRTLLAENELMFFEYAVPVASAYAVKHKVDFVRHERISI